MREWINKGDTPFLNGGGCLIAECDDYDEYDVLRVNTEAGDDGKSISAELIRVDLSLVSDENIREAMFACGYEDECEGKTRGEIIEAVGAMNVVKEVVETLGGVGIIEEQNIDGDEPVSLEDTLVTEEALVEWMRKLGAGEFAE